MQLVHAQQLLAQADVAVELVQIGVHGVHQVVIDLGRHPGVADGGGQGGVVLPGGGEELALLHLGAEHRRSGVLEAAAGVVILLIGGAAQLPVLAHLVGDEGGVGQGQEIAVPIHRVGEGEIGVGELGVDVVRGLGHLPGGGQQLLLRVRQGVLLLVLDDGEVPGKA